MNDNRRQLFEAMTQFDKTLSRARCNALQRFNLTVAQAHVLLLCQETPRIQQLADMISATSSAATQIVESVEEKGLIIRRRAESDKRVVMVYLTEAGRRLVKQIENERRAFAYDLLNELSDQDVEVALLMYRKITTHIAKRFSE